MARSMKTSQNKRNTIIKFKIFWRTWVHTKQWVHFISLPLLIWIPKLLLIIQFLDNLDTFKTLNDLQSSQSIKAWIHFLIDLFFMALLLWFLTKTFKIHATTPTLIEKTMYFTLETNERTMGKVHYLNNKWKGIAYTNITV